MKKKAPKMFCISSILLFSAILVLGPTSGYAEPSNDHLILNQLVYEIKNPQTDAQNFRNCLEKIGEYLAIQVMGELNTKEVQVQTLTGATATHHLCDEEPVLVTILRAGVPLNLGVQKVFPNAQVGFLGMSRDEETLQANIEYVAIPEVKNKCVVITDTMIATGGSILDAIKIVEKLGPRKIVVIGAIASEPGIARILSYNPSVKIYAAATDPKLNEKGYIIPGLGDAGDRSYGIKINLDSKK